MYIPASTDRCLLTKDIMKNGSARAFGAFLSFVLVSCGNVRAQTANPNQTDSDRRGEVAVTATAQADTPQNHAQVDPTYIIGNDDLLSISVWKEPDLSKQIPVRSDGRISLPLVGEVQATGRTPPELEQEIAAKLKNYITAPQVTVIVQQINSQKFNVLGQVNKPGAYSLTAGTTIVDAIAIAGGFRDFAKKKSIYVLRQSQNVGEIRLPFNYENFLKGKDPAQNVQLKPHDTVVVP